MNHFGDVNNFHFIYIVKILPTLTVKTLRVNNINGQSTVPSLCSSLVLCTHVVLVLKLFLCVATLVTKLPFMCLVKNEIFYIFSYIRKCGRNIALALSLG